MNEELESIIKDLTQAKKKLDELKVWVANDPDGESWFHIKQIHDYVVTALNHADWFRNDLDRILRE